MRPLALASLLALSACAGEDPAEHYDGLYSIAGVELTCPTADLVETFGIDDGVPGGPDLMGLCRWDCRNGELLLLRFLRTSYLDPTDPWHFDAAFTDACLP